MKRTPLLLSAKQSLFLFTLGLTFISCKKDTGSNTSPDPSGPKPIIFASAPQPGWYDSSITASFTVTSVGNYNVTASTDNGTPIQVNGNTYTLTGVRGLTRVSITATNTYGSSTKTVDISVYNQVVSNLCAPVTNSGPWRKLEEYYSTDSIIWTASPTLGCRAPVNFRPDFTCSLFATACGSPADHQSAPWNYNPNGEFLTWESFTQRILSLNKRRYIGVSKTPTSTVWFKEVWER